MKRKSNQTELPLRDFLAIDRTRLANRRTLLAFVRTGIYFIATALGIFEFGKAPWLEAVAWLFVVIGIVCMATGLTAYFVMRKKIEQSAYDEAEQNGGAGAD